MDFSQFDQRNYRTLPVQEGYAEWAASYEETPLEAMDTRLLDRLTGLEWSRIDRAIDLACGTGRIGDWLNAHGVRSIDGVDFTPQMLERARARNAYDRLSVANVTDTALPDAAYHLATMSLADEHLPDLNPLYHEAARITHARGLFLLIGYHPHFLLNGMPTHYHRPDGEAVTIQSFVHLLSDHVRAASASGWILRVLDEALIGDDWIARKPKWERWRNHPVSFLALWEKRGAG